jgi:DNA repair protein RecN (Recombination protein N)
MLKYLNISNFAVISRLEVPFDTGLNLLTGETGSGKSIIVDSLSLLMGSRSSALQVRTGERVATVEGLFEIGGEVNVSVKSILEEAGIELVNGSELLIRREIYANGRSRFFVEDQSVTAATLRSLQPKLVAIHGQGEQRSLLSSQSQMDLLDSFGSNQELRRSVGEAYRRWRAVTEEISGLKREMLERERTADLLRYELSEIERIAPKPLEDHELANERRILTHAEKLVQLGAGAYTELYERDGSVIDRVANLRRQLEELSTIDTRIIPFLELLQQSYVGLVETAEGLRSYGEEIEFSPGRLAQVEERLAELERLKRKYNTDLEGILKVQEELSLKLQKLSDMSEREEALNLELARAAFDYRRDASQLTERRLRAGEALSARVMEDLKFVAMEQACFSVMIETAQDSERESAGSDNDSESSQNYFTPHGADRVEFYLSANPGEAARPLSRVASGGELSRLMLTLRTLSMTGADGAGDDATVVFDEIDVGIGGRVAEAVGRRLKNLAAARQVLCVTHQPQIARFASHHLVVSKEVSRGRTNTIVKQLLGDERVEELARMIGGGEESAETTIEAARWLLKSAEADQDVVRGTAKRKGRQKILTRE